MNENIQCLIGVLIPFLGTSLGAAVVFVFRKEVSSKWQKIFLGFAAGVMFAAAIWSLIIPAIEMSETKGKPRMACSNCWNFAWNYFFISYRSLGR